MEMTNGRPISRSHPPLDGDWWAEGDGDTIIELQFELFFFCPFVRDGCHFFVSSHPRYLCHSSWVTFFFAFCFVPIFLFICVCFLVFSRFIFATSGTLTIRVALYRGGIQFGFI